MMFRSLAHSAGFLCMVSLAHAQPVITSEDLPDAGDLLIQRTAVLTGEVDLEFTGPDAVWTFGPDILQPSEILTETACLDVNDVPFAYQIFFNNPWDPELNSDFVTGEEAFDMGGFTFEDVYTYYQNRPDRYAITGQGLTVNNLPTGAFGDPVDVIYHLPLEYGDQSTGASSYTYAFEGLGTYQTDRIRTNACNGWGTLQIWEQSYPVLHVRTVIQSTDSVYIDFFGLGQSFTLPETVEYKWLSPDFKVPVLQITATGGLVTSVLTADIPLGMEEGVVEGVRVVRLGQDAFEVKGNQEFDSFSVHDALGREVINRALDNQVADVSGLAGGTYMLILRGGKTSYPYRFAR